MKEIINFTNKLNRLKYSSGKIKRRTHVEKMQLLDERLTKMKANNKESVESIISSIETEISNIKSRLNKIFGSIGAIYLGVCISWFSVGLVKPGLPLDNFANVFVYLPLTIAAISLPIVLFIYYIFTSSLSASYWLFKDMGLKYMGVLINKGENKNQPKKHRKTRK